MSNEELLLAISNLMDSKLKSELQPIKNDLQFIKDEVATLKKDVAVLKEDVATLKGKMSIEREKSDIIWENLQSLQSDVHSIQLCQENVLLPRLDTIESCYTGTYNRYKNNADKMDAVFEDVQLVKQVVETHSQRLQKLA